MTVSNTLSAEDTNRKLWSTTTNKEQPKEQERNFLLRNQKNRKRSPHPEPEPDPEADSKWIKTFPETTGIEESDSNYHRNEVLHPDTSSTSGEVEQQQQQYTHNPSTPNSKLRLNLRKSIDCCPTRSEWISPRGGVSREGRILEVFQDNVTNMIQTFQQHSCFIRDKPCLFQNPMFDTRCRQKYSFTYAIVREYNAPEGTPWRLDQIRIRSGCQCQIMVDWFKPGVKPAFSPSRGHHSKTSSGQTSNFLPSPDEFTYVSSLLEGDSSLQ